MTYKLTEATKLKVCADQVGGIISQARFRDTKWTLKSLQNHLHGIGLEYTEEELKTIIEELVKRSVIQEVKE